MYIVMFLLFGAGFGLLTYAHRHFFSEGPHKVETTQDGSTWAQRVLWAMVCAFLWPIMVVTGLNSAWILAKRKRQAALAEH